MRSPKKKDPRRLSRRGSLESASLFGLSEALKHLIPGPRGLATTATTRTGTAHTDASVVVVAGTHGVGVVLGLGGSGGGVVDFEHAGRIDHDRGPVKMCDLKIHKKTTGGPIQGRSVVQSPGAAPFMTLLRR